MKVTWEETDTKLYIFNLDEKIEISKSWLRSNTQDDDWQDQTLIDIGLDIISIGKGIYYFSNHILTEFPEYLYNSNIKSIIQFERLSEISETKTLDVAFFENTNLIEIKLKDTAWYGEFHWRRNNPEIEFIYLTENFELVISSKNQPIQKVFKYEIKYKEDIISDRLYYDHINNIFDIKNKVNLTEDIDFNIEPSFTEIFDNKFLLIGDSYFNSAIIDINEDKLLFKIYDNDDVLGYEYYPDHKLFIITFVNTIRFIDTKGIGIKYNDKDFFLDRIYLEEREEFENSFKYNDQVYVFENDRPNQHENYLEYISKENNSKIVKIRVSIEGIILI